MLSQADLKLKDGSRIAVIGGGPAGSFFSYFLLDMAERVGRQIQVDIYEPRDFNVPGPPGCNMCAGVVSESLVQTLAAEGINLPPTVVQRGIDSYVLHMDVGSVRIESLRHEKRIAATFRGIGPCGLQEFKWDSLDNHLMALAVKKGAHHVRARVNEVEWVADPTTRESKNKLLQVKTHGGKPQTYELLAVTAGVNTALLKLLQELDFGYHPPRTTKCFVREYYLGQEAVERNVGASFHAFLLNIPRLDYAAVVPKGDHATLALLGEDIDSDLLHTLTNDPALKRCFPPDFPIDQVACGCAPRINIKGGTQPFGDRIVFIGDSGVSRLYKDGIGAAYRAAKAAATTAIFEGISAEDFKRHYSPTCRAMEMDNTIGKVLFAIVREIQKRRFARRAVLRMVLGEQRSGAVTDRSMSMVTWDMLTGSAAYREIFLRTLHPAFWARFLWELGVSFLSPDREIQTTQSAALTAHDRADGHSPQPREEHAMEPGALGRVYEDGEIIVRQGEIGDCMFVIQEGQVEVFVGQDGEETPLGVRGPGEFFGEMAIFEREARMATVRALGRARILTVDEENFMRRIHEDPSLAYHMVQTMSHRMREMSAELAALRPATRSGNHLQSAKISVNATGHTGPGFPRR
jgi:flavin-dependent dehydrogenase